MAKSDTEKSAELTVQLVERFDAYERGLVKPIEQKKLPKPPSGAQLRATEKALETYFRMFPKVSDASKQLVFAKAYNSIHGEEIYPLPVLEDKSVGCITTSEIASQIGISPQICGKYMNSLCLKTDENREVRLTKSEYSTKEVEQDHWFKHRVDFVKNAIQAHIAALPVKSRR